MDAKTKMIRLALESIGTMAMEYFRTADRDKALAELDAMEARVADLTRERDDLKSSRDALCKHANEQSDTIAEQEAEVERLNAEAKHDGEIVRRQISLRGEAESRLAAVREWTNTYGRALCPGLAADSFGEGMREAKKQVGAILRPALDRALASTDSGEGEDEDAD